MKTKIKSHGDEVTDFYDKEISKLDSNHTYLAIINLDSVLQETKINSWSDFSSSSDESAEEWIGVGKVFL